MGALKGILEILLLVFSTGSSESFKTMEFFWLVLQILESIKINYCCKYSGNLKDLFGCLKFFQEDSNNKKMCNNLFRKLFLQNSKQLQVFFNYTTFYEHLFSLKCSANSRNTKIANLTNCIHKQKALNYLKHYFTKFCTEIKTGIIYSTFLATIPKDFTDLSGSPGTGLFGLLPFAPQNIIRLACQNTKRKIAANYP